MKPCTPTVRLTTQFLAILVGLSFAFACDAAEEKASSGRVLKAGAFAADTTPLEFPVSVNGGMRDNQATEAHDRLHARALVLDNGQTAIAIVVCDACMIPRELMDEAKRLASKATGIPEDHMLIAATHTHEAPTLGGVFQSEPTPSYPPYFVEQVAKSITQAYQQREPAQIGWGVGNNPRQVFNRRWKMKPGTMPPGPFAQTTDLVKMNPGYQNPGLVEQAGRIDPDVSVLSVKARDGRPISVLANYSLHYVGGVKPLSADYFGEFAVQIRHLLGAENAKPPFVGIMSNGTSGDVNNVDFAHAAPPRRGPFEQIQIVAADVAKTAYDTISGIEYHAWVPIEMRERKISLGVRRPSAEDLADAEQVLKQAKGPVLGSLREVYAREATLLAKYPPTVECKLQAIRIGSLGIVSSPCETFVATGELIKRESPLKPTFVIELANGYNGYLPTPEQHNLGGYETWRARSSYLEVDASTKIEKTLLELLREVSGK